MALNPWKAPQEVFDLVQNVKNKHHADRLTEASIAVCFDDSKPFVRNKINLGKVTKFSHLAKLFQSQPYDFVLTLCSDLWVEVLDNSQREALIDLLLTRCQVEYIPETVEENGKKKPVKDEWGRIQYTKEVKTDEAGNPKWKVSPLDIDVFTENVRRYGLWLDCIIEFKDACVSSSANHI